jgi:hypothetical protein
VLARVKEGALHGNRSTLNRAAKCAHGSSSTDSQPVEATEHRMRQIMLTAAAATLALIPISHEIFWGPMAYAMMGGIVLGTALTLLCDLCGGDRPADQWAIFWIDAFS